MLAHGDYITLVLYVIVAKCTEDVVLTRRYIFQVIQVPSTPPEILTVRDTEYMQTYQSLLAIMSS